MYAQYINGSWKELAGRIKFSDTVYQTPQSLSDEQKQQFNVYLIQDAERPDLTRMQKFGNPSFTIKGNIVERLYPVIDKTAEELQQDLDGQSQTVRQIRNDLLQQSDWTQLPDAQVDKIAWVAYRQALRDVPLQPEFPWTVVWPNTP